LAAAALVAAAPPAAQAATPICKTGVVGVLDADGTLVQREVSGNLVKSERKTADKLPFGATNLLWFGSTKISTGYVYYIHTFSPDGHPRNVSVYDRTAEPNLTTKVTYTYLHSFNPRLVAGSGRYYIYGVDKTGTLKRWTRNLGSQNFYSYTDAKTVATNMGGLRTLSYSNSYKLGGKVYDFLVATTASGALKQIRIPWSSPGSETIKTLGRSGFQNYTGLSLSFCNDSTNYLSVVAINRTTGVARWFSLANVLAPDPDNLVNRGSIAPEYDWHMHATF
jgi:hypothetical protein